MCQNNRLLILWGGCGPSTTPCLVRQSFSQGGALRALVNVTPYEESNFSGGLKASACHATAWLADACRP